jgi:glycine/D-amino acid oxidase-like deaminating enzyme
MATTGFTLGPLMARMLAGAIIDPTALAAIPDDFAPDRTPASAPVHS